MWFSTFRPNEHLVDPWWVAIKSANSHEVCFESGRGGNRTHHLYEPPLYPLNIQINQCLQNFNQVRPSTTKHTLIPHRRRHFILYNIQINSPGRLLHIRSYLNHGYFCTVVTIGKVKDKIKIKWSPIPRRWFLLLQSSNRLWQVRNTKWFGLWSSINCSIMWNRMLNSRGLEAIDLTLMSNCFSLEVVNNTLLYLWRAFLLMIERLRSSDME